MRKLDSTRFALLAVAAAGIVAWGSTDASAFSRGSWGSSGSSGSYASYSSGSSGSYGSYSSGSSGSYASYSSGSSGSYASSGSSGSYGRPGLFARWHARKAARASSGSSGSYGSYGSSGSSGSYGSAGSSGSSGSGGSYGSYSASYSAVPTTAVASADASIHVSVPADALVYVNGALTKSTGADRQFVSRGLQSDMNYSYDVVVKSKDGAEIGQKTVTLRGGDAIELNFGADKTEVAAEEVKTELTLHVPAEAKVTLAGAATKQTGELRTYATTTLAPGQVWDGYKIRVEMEQDGKTLVEEKTISITGGKATELTIDFADASQHVAAVN